jgi:hypothetical protein
MIRQLPLNTPQPIPEPFHDILNHPAENANEDLQKETLKKGESYQQNTDSSKENHEEDEYIPPHDKTIKKEHNKYDPHTLSSKTIRE